jgi:hypothetical protein
VFGKVDPALGSDSDRRRGTRATSFGETGRTDRDFPPKGLRDQGLEEFGSVWTAVNISVTDEKNRLGELELSESANFALPADRMDCPSQQRNRGVVRTRVIQLPSSRVKGNL